MWKPISVSVSADGEHRVAGREVAARRRVRFGAVDPEAVGRAIAGDGEVRPLVDRGQTGGGVKRIALGQTREPEHVLIQKQGPLAVERHDSVMRLRRVLHWLRAGAELACPRGSTPAHT